MRGPSVAVLSPPHRCRVATFSSSWEAGRACTVFSFYRCRVAMFSFSSSSWGDRLAHAPRPPCRPSMPYSPSLYRRMYRVLFKPPIPLDLVSCSSSLQLYCQMVSGPLLQY
mmetsp:Transcript_20474/g.47868  ORF Transcript_20474/g.47868 Transcript_20474/m.47868 type:complete len:111 (+) Transcript_20474:301-633(+)